MLATAACALVLVSAGTAAQQRRPQTPMAPPGETGRRVNDEGLLANYFPAPRKAPALLMLGGSVGGLSIEANNAAKALQTEGFAVLHLAYFRGPGQNPRLELVPLEYFSTAFAWLGRQAEVDSARMGIVGGSKGAEAALVFAARHPELKAVLAYMPSSVIWPGIGSEETSGPIGSSWSEGGKPLPYLPNPPYDPRRGGTMADDFAASLTARPQHPDAIIPVERIAAPILLVCGQADRTWPSCPMARQIQQRLAEHHRPAATLLAYDDAGHTGFGLPVPLDDPRLTIAGGTAQGTSAARADSWPKAVAFLKSHLEK
jgi:hypothetical protein